MRKILTRLFAALGFTSACGQQNFENLDVASFSKLISDQNVAILDVRTASEFQEGHINDALNIDIRQSGFLDKAKSLLPADKTIAVYCRSGRRSAQAASQLSSEGFKVVNLKGGILAWEEANMPTTTVSYETDVFTTQSGKTIKFYALVHASIRIVYDDKEIEVDPVKKLGNRTIDYSVIPAANYILVTHEHGDHFDKDAIKQLSGDNTTLVTNKRCADMLGYGDVMKNGDKMTVSDGITIEAVPAYNNTEGHLQFHPKGRDNGFILTVDGTRIYIAGDTEDIPEMSDIKDIDIAFMPCNQPYTMTVEQLVKAAKTVKPKVLFPYHYGQTDVSKIPSLLQDEGIDVRIRHYE